MCLKPQKNDLTSNKVIFLLNEFFKIKQHTIHNKRQNKNDKKNTYSHRVVVSDSSQCKFGVTSHCLKNFVIFTMIKVQNYEKNYEQFFFF